MKIRKVLALVLAIVIMASCTACTTIELVIPVAGVPAVNTNTTPDNGTQTPAPEATTPTTGEEETTGNSQLIIIAVAVAAVVIVGVVVVVIIGSKKKKNAPKTIEETPEEKTEE